MTAPQRPVLRWHGGKWKLAPWIIGHFPAHRVYVEPFGGAASVLLRKARAYAEIYNDLDDEVVNLFRVLRDHDTARDLQQRLELTPFARREFETAWEVPCDTIERARHLVVRALMGFGSHGHSDMRHGAKTTGFRAGSNRSGTTPAHDWMSYPAALPSVVERLAGVVIENRPAEQVMAAHDGAETLHYVDPPYLPETRGRGNIYDPKHQYRHELTAADHEGLLTFLRTLDGMVVLSGYPSALYDARLVGWERIEMSTFADGARPRTEVLWLNPACSVALSRERRQPGLFEVAAE